MRKLYRLAARHSADEPFQWVTDPIEFEHDDWSDPQIVEAHDRIHARYSEPGAEIKFAATADDGSRPNPWMFAEYKMGMPSSDSAEDADEDHEA